MTPRTGLKRIVGLLLSGILGACATYVPQTKPGIVTPPVEGRKVSHTFYFVGGFGDTPAGPGKEIIRQLEAQLGKAPATSTLIFTGDNITPRKNNRKGDRDLLEKQLRLIAQFKGNTIFIPGNNEWKSHDAGKMEKVEEYLDSLDNDRIDFLPKNACPIEREIINDQLDLIIIDSKWFISNWSRIKDINKKCPDIVTRRRFMEALEGYINDAQDKNIVIAMHHPIFSNGKYAAKETFKGHMWPVPILGTLLNGIKDLDGLDPDRLNFRQYNYLRVLVGSLAKASGRIIIVSGHEKSLQYLTGGDIQQIISGSLSAATATKRSRDKIVTIGGSMDYKGIYTHGTSGFTRLDYFSDGSSRVSFFSPFKQEPVEFNILPKLESGKKQTPFPPFEGNVKKTAIIEDRAKTDKSAFYNLLWGERYRAYYGKQVSAPVADLDTLYGGLTVLEKGGGHQSNSLRLGDDQGREYAMRSLRKNALKFLKYKVKGVAFTANEYDNTWTEELVSDFFTTSHPYMQLVIPPLARAAGINHAGTRLYYVPRQETLGEFNGEYGNELYFIEERPSEQFAGFEGYNRAGPGLKSKIKDFESTTDVFEKIQEDEQYTVDQKSFIRARIFDMLIGDWDRHEDQWRWAEYETKDDNSIFVPIPRDRDAAFSRFDGLAIPVIRLFVPDTRFWQSYDTTLKDVKWFNAEGNNIDRTLLTRYGPEIWEEEAKQIQKGLTSGVIDQAFLRIPVEVRDSTASQIKESLHRRLERLPEYARDYGRYLNKVVALHGTEKDDSFEITRLEDGKTRIVIRRLLRDDPNKKIYERTFDPEETREIWVYGLGDNDLFKVTGEGDGGIFLRLVGGYGEDHYTIANRQSLKVYDWKYEKSVFEKDMPRKQFTNQYETNTFHWRFFNESNNVLAPNLGYNGDDGFYFGAADTYTYNGLNGNPFRQKHMLSANFYTQFNALELDYKGIFGNVIPGWNFEVGGYYTSERFRYNFYGFGNETVNFEDTLGMDFNRAGLQEVKLHAGVAFYTLRIKALYESFKLLENENSYFTPSSLEPEIFDVQHYLGAETSFEYSHDDAEDFPTKAIYFGITGGYKWNMDLEENKFGYLRVKAGLSYRLIPSGDLVLGSVAEVNTNFGKTYFFYHSPSLGWHNGLRGFRDQRFSGKTLFYQTTDLRLRVKKFITAVAPVTVGIYGGFDYGRVWVTDESSVVWHTSQGGGIWVGGYNYLSLSAGYFNSVEGNILQIGFGFGF